MAETTTPSTPGPKGVLPKNVQTWLMAGLAGVVIIAIFLGGAGEKKRPAAGTAAASPTPVTLSDFAKQADEIADRQKRMEAEAEQMRKQTEAMLAARGGQGQPPQQPWVDSPTDVATELRRKEKEREITSLYASSLAQSYRQTVKPGATAPTSAGTAAAQPDADLDRTLRELDAQLGRSVAAGPTTAQPSGTPGARPPAPTYNQVAPGGHQYVFFEGSVIEAVLQNRLNSDFSGPVLCLVSTPVYSRDRQRVLIPVGTRLVGESAKVAAFGQSRLAVAFHRLVMPDGYTADLDQFTGLNAIGETALRDKVNNHYLQIFGSSILLGGLSGLSLYGTQSGGLQGTSAADSYRQGIATSLADSGSRILDKFLNILPTLTIREGHRVRVYSIQDLKLPAYDDHRMPANL